MNFPIRSVRPAAGLLLAIGASVSLSILSVPGAAAAAPAQNVRISNFAFAPAVVTVPVGTTVTWTNADEDPHTVVATGKAFHSTALDTDDKFSFTFTRPGEYAYFCSLHPHMTGKIIVRPS
jgi:plastocyanin